MYDLDEYGDNPIPAELLPQWVYDDDDDYTYDDDGPEPEDDAPEPPEPDESEFEPDNDELEVEGSGDDWTLYIPLGESEIDELLERFQVDNAEELSDEIALCLTSGVAFTLEEEHLDALFRRLRCNDVGELSEKVKKQLVKKVS